MASHNKPAKSLRQQIKAVCELDKAEVSSGGDTDAVLYFPAEFRYSTVKIRQLIPPHAKAGDVAKVKGRGKEVFTGTVLSTGSESSCREVQISLEAAMKIAERTKAARELPNNPASDTSDAEFEVGEEDNAESCSSVEAESETVHSLNLTLLKEKEKLVTAVAKLNNTTNPEQPSTSTGRASELESETGKLILSELKSISSLLGEIKEQMIKNNQLLSVGRANHAQHSNTEAAGRDQVTPLSTPSNAKRSRTVPLQEEESISLFGSDDKHDLIYNGIHLLSEVYAPPKDPALYGTKLLGILFSAEELEVGAVEKSARSTRRELDPQRIGMLKSKEQQLLG